MSLIKNLFRSVTIPPAVGREITPSLPLLPDWITVEPLRSRVPEAVLRNALGLGEREAIALAVESKPSLLIVDDLPARKVARMLGVDVVGTAGILLAAKRRGFVESLRTELDRLIQNSFFLSPKLYNDLLQAADEPQEG